ncbi:MAG: autotransporter outer membrane beta-barrel domain-containing protein [Pseudomonadota bacterium]
MRSTACLAAAAALLFVGLPAVAQETEGNGRRDRPVSLAEVQGNAARVVPIALGLEVLQGDVARRARLRLLEGPEGGVDGVSIWGGPQGAFLDFDSEGFDGAFVGGAIGIDFDIDTDWVVGFRLGFEHTDLDTAIDGIPGNMDSRGLALTFYAAWQPYENWVIDGFLGAGRTAYDFNNGGVTGTIDADRFTGGIGASAVYGYGNFQLSPRLELALAVDSAVGFFDSAGVEATNSLITYFEGAFGGEVAYPMSFGGTGFTPWLSAAVVGTLDEVGQASLVGDTVHGRVGAGLRLRQGRFAVDIEGRAAGFGGRDFNDYQGLLRLSVVF